MSKMPSPTIDPHLLIACQTKFRRFVSSQLLERRIGLVAELRDGKTFAEFVDTLPPNCEANRLTNVGRILTLVTDAAGAEKLAANCLLSRIQLATSLYGQRDARRPETSKWKLPRGTLSVPVTASESECLLATIDFGIPFAHVGLQGSKGTRIRSLWNQDASDRFAGLQKSPRVGHYGVAVDRRHLNAAIVASTSQDSVVNERLCYELAGYDVVRKSASHGAKNLGLFVGSHRRACEPPKTTTVPERDVVCVQLPRETLLNPSNSALARHILDGLAWILKQVRKSERTVIVCLPYGSPLGSHDVSSIIETGIAEIVEAAAMKGISFAVVISAGNDFNARQHAMIDGVNSYGRAELLWDVPPCSDSDSWMEIWMPKSVGKYRIDLRSPGGTQLASSDHDHAAQECEVVDSGWFAADGARAVLLRVSPTQVWYSGAAAKPGRWRISLSWNVMGDDPIHAYIGRSIGDANTASFNRQSKFASTGTNRDWCTSTGTLSGYACGKSVIVAGALEGPASDRPYLNGSSGPSRNLYRLGPNLSVSCSEFDSPGGLRTFGNTSGVATRLTGTSAAAAMVSRNFSENGVWLPIPSASPIDGRRGVKVD